SGNGRIRSSAPSMLSLLWFPDGSVLIMPAPDSSLEEIRASALRYLRMYEEGGFTLNDLAAELAVLAPAYRQAMGGIADSYGPLLDSAFEYWNRSDSSMGFESLELALT